MRTRHLHPDSLQRCLCPQLTRQALTNEPIHPAFAFSGVQIHRVSPFPNVFGPKIVRPNLVQPTELPAPAISGPKISRPDLTPPRPPRPPPVRPPPVKILRDVHPPTGQTPLEHVLSLCNDPPRNSVGRVDPSFVFKAATSYVARGLLTPSIEVYEQLLALTAAASSNRYQNEAFAMVDEMRQHGIIPTGRVYRSLLKLLSKSPDYIRRAQVLAEMRVRWVVVDDEAWAHVVIGALKDCQVEIAMEMIEERERIGGVVAGIVWKELVGVLTGMGDVSEALAVLQKVEGVLGEAGWQPGTLSGQQWKRLWYDLLVAAAKNMNTKVLQAAWSTSIGHLGALPLFDPPLGLCTLILNAAARTALPALALEVISYIQAAELPVYEHHYAALLEAHARAGDHLSTFAVLSTMRAARVSPTPNTAHAAVMTLAASRSATDTAASLLAASSTPVDIAAVELIMQAYTLHHDLDAAFATYSLIPDVCPREQRASLRTFNILLAGCMRTRNWEFAQYVRAEMRELGVELDAGTYSMLVRVLVAVEEGGEGGPGEALFEAFVHLEEMKSKALRMAKIAYEELACACARRGEEERTKAVVREMEDVGWGAEGVWETLEREGLWWGPVDSTVESGCE